MPMRMTRLICRNLSAICTENDFMEWVKNMDKVTMEQKIARINALYHKSQAEGLTEEEKAEQAVLRQEYVASVRANLRGQLNSITIQREDGTLENLGEKYGGQ